MIAWMPEFIQTRREKARPVPPAYLRLPRVRFFRRDWRVFAFLRFGFVMTNVPLPRFSAL